MNMRVSMLRWLAAGALIALATGLIACGGGDPPAAADRGGTTAPSSEVTPTTEPPTEVPVNEVTDAELIVLAEAIYPGDTAFASCDIGGNTANCPVTERLADTLKDPNTLLCRCQNGSTTREIAVIPERLPDGGGIVRVSMWEGRVRFDLVVVHEGDEWLVDDQYCSGRPETSIHEYAGLC
jgi:hypothetical protein